MIHRFAHFELDAASHTLRARGELVELPPKAVELLALLVQRRGSVVTKSELMDALWPEGFVEEANLTQQVYLLRRAFRECGAGDPIETAPRRGYCFKAPIDSPRRREPLVRYLVAAAAAIVLVIAASSGGQRAVSAPLRGEALQAYTLGRYFFDLRSMNAMQRSIPYFRTAITLAPHNALGYAALADAYTELADFAHPCAQCPAWQRDAEHAARQAIATDPSSAEAHVAYGMIRRVFYNDDARAAREFRTALRIDPGNALANHWYGNMLIANGSAAEGIRRLRLAAAEEPISTTTYAWLARGYYYERRYDQAIRYARQALALEPTRLETIVLLGLAEEARGDLHSALHQFALAGRMGATRADTQALIAGVQAVMGRRQQSLASLHRIARQRNLDIYAQRDVAIALEIAGDKRGSQAALARIRYSSPLDRQLIAQDPHITSILH
jgi:DNA-binding winged helix-turn-helix (wHTH) protein/Tfp pilus assembly protein PilF